MSGRSIREHKAVAGYLDEVCGQIRAKELHEEIRIELACHLEELVYEKLDRIEGQESEASAGEPTDEALEQAVGQAIKQMGNPRTVGRQLHKVHKPKTEWSLLALVATLIGIGLMTMNALQQAVDFEIVLPLLSNKLFFVGFGSALLIGLYFADYRKLRALAWPIYGLTLALFILARIGPFSDRVVNGSFTWITVGGFSLDVSALAPYLFLVSYAGYLASGRPAPASLAGRFRDYGTELILYYALPAVLYLLSPSLVSLAVHFVSASALLLTRKQGWRSLLAYGSTLLLAFASAVFVLRGFRFAGIQDSIMYQRWLNYLRLVSGDDAAATLPSRDFIRDAGLWGHGFDAGVGRLLYPYSDNVVAYLVGSLGWIFGIGLAALVAAFVYRSVRIASSLKDPFARLLVIALSGILAVKLVWTLLMSVGLLPFAGISMPFISYSGLQTVIEMASIGLLLAAFRRKDCIPRPASERMRRTSTS